MEILALIFWSLVIWVPSSDYGISVICEKNTTYNKAYYECGNWMTSRLIEIKCPNDYDGRCGILNENDSLFNNITISP